MYFLPSSVWEVEEEEARTDGTVWDKVWDKGFIKTAAKPKENPISTTASTEEFIWIEAFAPKPQLHLKFQGEERITWMIQPGDIPICLFSLKSNQDRRKSEVKLTRGQTQINLHLLIHTPCHIPITSHRRHIFGEAPALPAAGRGDFLERRAKAGASERQNLPVSP